MRSIPYHNGKTVYISAGDKPPPYPHNVRTSGHITPCAARNITHNNVVHITSA